MSNKKVSGGGFYVIEKHLMPRPSRNSNKIELLHSPPPNKKSSAETTPTPPTILGDTTEEDTDHAIDIEEEAPVSDGANENHANKKASDDYGTKTSSVLGKRIFSAINNLSEERLLQAIVVATDDRSLEMSLDTEYTTQSLVVNSVAKSIAITPIPSTWLLIPIHIRVRINIRHNSRWIKPCKTIEFANTPDILHTTFVVMLNCGLNIVEIFVRPPKGNNRKEKKKKRSAIVDEIRGGGEDVRNAAVEDVTKDIEKGKMKDSREKIDMKVGVDKNQSLEDKGMTKGNDDDYEDSDEHYLEPGQRYTLFITRLEEENWK